jgi:two-component system sensor histidine kinase AtoS
VSLRTKFVLATALVTALLMVAVMLIVERRQRAAIVGEVHRRGTVLAESLAAAATGPLLLYNFTALEQSVTRLDAQTDDVTYAVVLDADGRVAAHSREPGQVGGVANDEAARRARDARAPLVQDVAAGGQPLYDFAVPVVVDGQRWGTVRVGLSRRRMEAEIARTRRELVGLATLALVAGGLAAALVAGRIARPVRELARGATAIARGDLDVRVEAATSDEIGRLAEAFRHMAGQLGDQRRGLARAEAELRRQLAELSDLQSYTDHILRSLTSGVITLDLDGRVVTVNPAAEVLTGRLAAEVAGKPCTEAFAHLPALRDVLLQTVASRAGTALAAISLDPGAGPGRAAVELTTAPLRGAEGRLLGLLAVLRDVSAVRQLEEQLRRSDRLAAVGTLAAGLAHEIKNPLTSVLTFSRHLARRFADERFRQRFQSVVPRELERINGIVDGLLRLARPGRLTLAPVALPELLDRALELYGQQIEARRITVVREYAVGLPAIAADPEHLYQAVVNLVTNALDAMDEGGTLTVRAGWAAGPGAVAAPGPRGERLRLEVEDTGPGIPASDSSRVFNPFFTTKATGTGLGLAITHKIVEDHGGSITFRSGPGPGTTFTILLPPAVAPPSDRRTDDGVPPASRAREAGGA